VYQKFISPSNYSVVMERRAFLTTSGALSSGLLAGCIGGGQTGQNTDNVGTDTGIAPRNVEGWPPENYANSLNVWSWNVSWRDWMAKNFQNQYEVNKVNVDAYSNPSQWYVKLQSGNHRIDNVASTGTFTERASTNGLLERLPEGIMPSWEHIKEEDKKITREVYGPAGWKVFGLPYSNSMVPVLTYNEEFFDSAPDSWSILWEEDLAGKMVMQDRFYTMAEIGALYTGQDPVNPSDYKEIEEVLIQQKEYNLTYWSDFDATQQLFANGKVVVGPFLPSRTTRLRFDQNKPINYNVPKEGGFWGGNHISIPAGSPHKVTSLLFTNFALSKESVVKLFELGDNIAPVKGIRDEIEEKTVNGRNISKERFDFANTRERFPKRSKFRPPLDPEVRKNYQDIYDTVRAA